MHSLVKTVSAPISPDDEGIVSLELSSTGVVLDQLHYYDDWHYPFWRMIMACHWRDLGSMRPPNRLRTGTQQQKLQVMQRPAG